MTEEELVGIESQVPWWMDGDCPSIEAAEAVVKLIAEIRRLRRIVDEVTPIIIAARGVVPE